MKPETLILVSAALASTATAAKANVMTPQQVNQVKADLRLAICTQNWQKAVDYSSLLMASSAITPEHRQELVDWRQRFSNYAATSKQFESVPSCENVRVPVPVKRFEENRARGDFNWRTETARISQSEPLVTARPRFVTTANATGNESNVSANGLTVTDFYNSGSTVYGTVQNNTNTVYRNVRVQASVQDRGTGLRYSAYHTHDGVINPGSKIRIPVTIPSTLNHSEPGHNLYDPDFSVYSSTPQN